MAITNLQKEIMRQVILAHVASDSGKNMAVSCTAPGTEVTINMGYKAKKTHIEKAVKLINGAPPCGISYNCGVDDRGKRVIYFNISGRIAGRWKQISFHCPNLKKGSYMDILFQKWAGKKTSWAGERTGKTGTESRESCKALAAICGWSYTVS